MSSALSAAITTYMDANGGGEGLFTTAIDGLSLFRSSHETLPNRMIYKPSLCMVAQGAKEVICGEQVLEYEGMQSLIVSVEVPILSRVSKASIKEPYLGVTLDLDVSILREVTEQLDAPPKQCNDASLGLFISDIAEPLADCVLRLVRLLRTPRAVPILYKPLMREVSFWLLTGPNGGEVVKLAVPDSHTQRIARAIHLLRDGFSRPMSIEHLAETAGMSASSFHHHFKRLTAMTPLQYQKQLRLLEARRLMVSNAANVSDAAYGVGYESASQFSREYARMFGVSPKRDIANFRAVPA